jgi:pimeloyl-ACP methyl ester carboxylesterase
MSDPMLSQRLAAYRAVHPPRCVTTAAGTFEYTVGGTGDRTVVLLHGGGSVAEATHPFALALELALRVIAIDWPASVRTVDDVLRGILKILDAEQVRRCALIGFSMGGMLGQCLARAHPERIDKLVLYVSMGPSRRYARRFRFYRWMLGLVPEAWLRTASQRAIAKWIAQGDATLPAADLAFVADHRRAMFDSGKVGKRSLLSDADVLIDFFSRDFRADAPGACDVLIIEAARDRMVDAVERERLRRLYPRAQVITLDDADHFAGVLAPDSVTAILRAFVAPG